MLKYCLPLAFLALAQTATAAPLVTVYGGAHAAYVMPTGNAGSGAYSAGLQTELGYDRSIETTFYIGVKHAVPALPNLRLSHTRFSESATNLLAPGRHGGTPRPALIMDSQLEINSTDLALYYTPIKHPLTLNVGLDLRRLAVDFSLNVKMAHTPVILQSIRKKENQVLPALYTDMRANFPTTHTYVTGQVIFSHYNDKHLLQGRAGLGWAPGSAFAVELGYRYELQKFSSNDFNIDMTTKGPYLSLIVRL